MRFVNSVVGLFMLTAFIALVLLAIRVSGLSSDAMHPTYTVTAVFENVGDLKPRSAVKVAGVKVGEVTKIELDRKTFRAVVSMDLDSSKDRLPRDSSADILTSGLLGSNYVNLNPGFEQSFLAEGSRIEETHPALILENLIGQFLFKMKDDKDS